MFSRSLSLIILSEGVVSIDSRIVLWELGRECIVDRTGIGLSSPTGEVTSVTVHLAMGEVALGAITAEIFLPASMRAASLSFIFPDTALIKRFAAVRVRVIRPPSF